MSLSKKIIYGSDQEVANLLKTKPELNIIDEYGYTPLIQTAIVNSTSKAKILLAAKADIDFPDLTGRTALFWAADNNNLELCDLCLKSGANPNAYSSGGQPILVMPLLKNYQGVKKLLIDSGAKLDFAQDFLNAKLIGHSFELEGRVDIVDTNNTFIEVELEGFYLRFTLEIIASSLHDFKNNFGAKKLRKYFSHLDTIITALNNAINLIRLQHYLVDIKKFLEQINNLLDNEPLILPLAFGGHAITLTKFADQLIRCDRGEFGKTHGPIIYYAIKNPGRLTKDLCRELLYKRQSPEFINTGLVDYLGLNPQKTLGLALQKTGNCSWANVEAVIPALMYSLLLEERGTGNEKICEQEAFDFYARWRDWNKTRSLDFCIQSVKESNPSRQAAKAALLAAILFQACDENDPQDQQKASKILTILSQKKYFPVLKCYAKIFSQNKETPLWQNFYNYLDNNGINVEKLLK